MKNKKILIVNWGTQSSDYVFKATKVKGLEIYLACGKGYPSWILKFVKKENIIITNTYDSEKLLTDVVAFMAENKVKFAAVTTFFEMNVIQTADLANVLGFDFLPPAAARKTSANKLMMRVACTENNLPTPEYAFFTNAKEGFAKLKKIGVPAVIKPVKSGHSYGIFYVDRLDFDLFSYYFDKAKMQINTTIDEWMPFYGNYKNDFLLEKYVEGDVYSVDGLVQDGRVMIYGFAKFDMGKLPIFVQESVRIPANYSEEVRRRCFDIAESVVMALGLNNCGFHSEYRLSKDGPVLLEIAARPPGGNMTLAYKNAYGVDVVDMYLDICLGKKVSYKYKKAKRVIIHKSHFDDGFGELLKIRGVDRLKKRKYFYLYWASKVGDVLYPKNELPASLIYYQITAKDQKNADIYQNEVLRIFKYKLKLTPKAIYERYLRKFLNLINV